MEPIYQYSDDFFDRLQTMICKKVPFIGILGYRCKNQRKSDGTRVIGLKQTSYTSSVYNTKQVTSTVSDLGQTRL